MALDHDDIRRVEIERRFLNMTAQEREEYRYRCYMAHSRWRPVDQGMEEWRLVYVAGYDVDSRPVLVIDMHRLLTAPVRFRASGLGGAKRLSHHIIRLRSWLIKARSGAYMTAGG
jgi:hypothetical protein